MALTCILTKHDIRRYSYINHIFSFSENEKVKDKGFWTQTDTTKELIVGS